METKTCNKCFLEKPIDSFHNDKYTVDGKCKTCKNCASLKRYGRPHKEKRDKYLSKEFEDGTKLCTKCNEIKDKTEFYFMKSHGRHRSYCRLCETNSALQRTYKMSDEEFKKILDKKEKNVCDICGCGNQTKKGMHIDHNHETGEVRGLLCNNCNLAIGFFNDDIEKLKNAIKYLEQTKSIC